MDFKEQIKTIANQVIKLKDGIVTEEATKNAFIMPFIQTLGYNVFNPLEVVPEYTSDVGTKQGEKVDYAIIKDNKPIILIECKKAGVELNVDNESQLLRYFHVSPAKFGILTNGITYKFYSDLEQENVMDKIPFLSFDITKIKDNQISELKKFHKDSFDFEKIMDTATELKYSNAVKKTIVAEMAEPSEEFVRFFANKAYNGRITAKVLEQFKEIVKKTFLQYINDNVTDRLQSALNKENEKQEEEQKPAEEAPKIITTDEEIEAFHIVRAILCSDIPLDRISYRDAQSYFSILFDDNNRKPICRLYLTESKKQIVLFDEEKREEKINLDSLASIYHHSGRLIAIAKFYAAQE